MECLHSRPRVIAVLDREVTALPRRILEPGVRGTVGIDSDTRSST
jgi:hypothetical protein